MMNEEQRKAIDTALEGHSFLLCGAAGTGKSHAVNAIVRELSDKGKSVMVVCSTGIACSQLNHAKTVHSVFGLRDGRYSGKELKHLFDTDDGYHKLKARIRASHTIVIDEVSMVSSYTLEQINVVARHVRQSEEPFGGLQRILVGDMFQLPPVPNELVGDRGQTCYNHPEFRKIVPHTINLRQVS
jgi:ATP-dependent exoDNAse (exonuclease V) alpha subunit